LLPIGIEVLRVMDIIKLDDAACLEKTVLRVHIVGSVVVPGEHDLAIFQAQEIAAYKGI
jgi:hypothetical protein